MPKVDETIVNFAVYEDGTEHYGMAEITLPEVSHITEEIKGAGMNGNYNAAVLGHVEAMTLTMNFRTVTRASYRLLAPVDHQLDLRVAQQARDSALKKVIVPKIKHIFVVRPTKMNPGKVAPASVADVSGEYSVSYWATYIDGAKQLEIDLFNFIYFVDGVDYLADVRKALGK